MHPSADLTAVAATLPPVCDFTVFGGTGDLALRKLLPALYHRDLEGHLPADTRIIGVSRSEVDDAGYRREVRAALERFVEPALLEEEAITRLGHEDVGPLLEKPFTVEGMLAKVEEMLSLEAVDA